MATHTISDVLYGIIRFRREGIHTGEFLLDQSITVANDDLINIVEDYTSDSGTASKTIFTGRVTYVDYNKSQFVQAVDVGDELNQVRPSGSYTGYTEVVIGELINDSSLVNITCTQTQNTAYLEPDGDASKGTWDDRDGGNDNDILYDDIDDGATPNDGTWIDAKNSIIDCRLSFPANGLSASYNYRIYQIDVEARSFGVSGLAQLGVSIYDGTTYSAVLYGDLHDDVWGADTFEFTDLYWTQDDVDNLQVRLHRKIIAGGDELRVSNIRVKIYYSYYANMKKGTVTTSYDFDGNSSIVEILKTLSITELYTWYYDPDLELHFDDGATVSGESLAATDSMKNINGSRQVMSYDKVILYGAYSGGAQLVSTRGVGDIIWRDNYLNVTTQTALDALADQILIEQGANTIKIQLMRNNATDGIYQVGETLAVADNAHIKFSGSDREIPDPAAYIINKIDYMIVDGVYNMLDIELIDGLLFTTPKTNTLAVVQDDAINNATGIAQVGGGESVGEANTGSNIGIDGVGVYDSKSGVTLQFRNIAPASAKITVTENGDDIDLDVGDIDAVAVAAVLADDAYLKNDANDETTGDLTVANLITAGNVDGRDISADLDQAVKQASSPTFVGLTLSADLVTSSTIDGKDVAGHVNNTTTEHGAVSAATASKFVVRDAAGRAKFVASNAAGDAVIHEQLHPQAHTLGSHTTKAHAELSDAPADAHHVAFVQANADALYSVLAHLHDDRYMTDAEVDQAIDDLIAATYTDAEINALLHDAVTVTAPITLVGQLINIENDVAAVITEIDTGALSELDTTIPTSKTVFDAVATKDTKEEAHAYVEATALTLENNLDMNGNNIIMGAGSVDGKIVSGLCTTPEARAYIEANGLALSANITCVGAQTVDGKDVSGLCTEAEAHAYVEATALTLENDLTMGGHDIISSDALNFKVAGVDVDYLQITTAGGHPSILTVGGGNLQLSPSGPNVVITGSLAISGLVDGVDVAGLKAAFDALDYYTQAEVAAAIAATYTNAEIDANTYTRAQVDTAVATKDTKEEAHAYVEATALTMTEIITFDAAQLFDGQDVSALAADLANQATEAEAIQAVEDAGLVLSASKSINIDGTPADSTYTGIVMDIDTTGCDTYDAVYFDGANSVAPADADSIATMPAIGIVVYPGKVLTHGVVKSLALWNFAAANKPIYPGVTPGEVDDTAPSGNGDIVQVIGVSIGADELFVNPSLDWVVVTL